MIYLAHKSGAIKKSRFSKVIYSSQTMWGVFVLGILALNLIILRTSSAQSTSLNNLMPLGGPDVNLSDSLTANNSPIDPSSINSQPNLILIPQGNIKSDALAQTFTINTQTNKQFNTNKEQNNPSNQLIMPAVGLNWGILHPHNAIDIANNCGTSIYASYEGFIIKNFNNSEWNDGYGNYIEIKHPNGLSTLYAHLEKSAVRSGQYVKTRELIGYMGETGNATGCHVHFEVHGGNNPFALK